ncbi:MAG TPA: type II CAAX endopeptidase family protein [Steroidobacteraceae bacterium]|nr:type II CAAX endopeptidase family protein [Steroidobacteraceae bacterium]
MNPDTPTAPTPAAQSRFKRFIQFPLTRVVVGFFWVGGFVALAEPVGNLLPPSWSAYKAVVLAVGALLGYYTYVRIVEQRQPAELLGRSAPLELVAGMIVGAILFSTTAAILYALGALSMTGRNDAAVMLLPFTAAIMAGVFEEILMRGVVFRIVEEWLGSAIAIAGSAILFGALHIPNPGSSAVSVIAIALEAGVMLAAAYILTRRLWLAIGIHIAWNFVQGGVFGIATSGVATTGWFNSTLSGPVLLTGGEFGAEASLVAVGVCLCAGIGMLLLAYRRKHWVLPAARRLKEMPAR